MSILKRIKPAFWDHQDLISGPHKALFNFRRIWYATVLLTSAVVLLPLITMAVIDYKVTQHNIESAILLRTARLVSNTQRTISFFLDERRAALRFIEQDNTCEELKDPERLTSLLEHLKKGVGGFVDLGIIEFSGLHVNYAGPYNLQGVNYSRQQWFKEVMERGVYTSDVFLGFRRTPHLVVAIRHDLPEGPCYVLRASLDMEKFNDLLSNLEMAGRGDAFLINREGLLQTPSLYHGKVFEKVSLPVPEYAPRTRVLEWKNASGLPLIIGYRYIADTPFILMVVKQKEVLMKPWYETRIELIGFLLASITIVLIVILGGGTYLVNRIYLADQRRVMILHEVEYSNKMASIGRLAAGVAHEINNPLAIINEKAGLIKDLLSLKEGFADKEQLLDPINSILASVERCGRITRRLLGFARHMDVSIQTVNLGDIVQGVLDFLDKEAEYRSIAVSVDIPGDLPAIESDRGKLQQIFLNLINNAFAAMEDNGHLAITAKTEGRDFVSITVADDGCGIPENDLKRIFEPFFSTKIGSGGTGLGLSITYGLVQELGGKISVQSEVGKGTSFTITLPLKQEQKER